MTAAAHPAASVPTPTGHGMLPASMLGYVWRNSRRAQVLLSLLSIFVFVLNTMPLELQRRIVNDTIKSGEIRAIVWLAAAYAGVALFEGAAKLLLNVYCGRVSENASRDLRKSIYRLLSRIPLHRRSPGIDGTEVSMILAEVEPIGGFVGISTSQPVLQGGILLSVFGYMFYLQPIMALMSLVVLAPQALFVPFLQRAINRRALERIQTLREVSGSIVADPVDGPATMSRQDQRIDHVFTLNMGIYKLKYSMNFLMNLFYHFGVAAILALGGWYVVHGQTEVGTIVAFISGLAKTNDPWGELVNWYRELTVVSVKYRLIAETVRSLEADQPAVNL